MSRSGARIILFVSGTAGSGQTAIIANLGATLAEAGKRVVLLDCHGGINNLSRAVRVGQKVVFDLSDLLEGSCDIAQAVIPHEKFERISFIAAPKEPLVSGLMMTDFSDLCAQLKAEYDFVLIDGPSNWKEYKSIIQASDEVVAVVIPLFSPLREAYQSLRGLAGMTVKIVVNRFRPELSAHGEMISPRVLEQMLELPVLECIPDDEMVAATNERGDVVVGFEYSPAAEVFKKVAESLMAEDQNFESYTDDSCGGEGQ